MHSVSFAGGASQIARVLTHTLKEARVNKVNAIVFVGDAMEEDVDELSRLAGQTDEGQVERLSRKDLHPFTPDVLVTLGGPLGLYRKSAGRL
jgi:hypothetical protein